MNTFKKRMLFYLVQYRFVLLICLPSVLFSVNCGGRGSSFIDEPPLIALDATLSTDEDSSMSIVLSAIYPEIGSLIWEIIDYPSHGSVSGTPPNLMFTPNLNYSGPDSLAFKVVYGAMKSGIATVNIDILPVNDPPTETGADITTDEDLISIFTKPWVIDPDTNDFHSFTVVSQPSNGAAFASSEGLAYQSNPNFSGSDLFYFRARDSEGEYVDGIANVTVVEVNDIPVADTQSVALNEDTPTPLTLTASDADNDPLTWTVGTPSHGAISGTVPNILYTPTADYSGIDSFDFYVNDGTVNSSPALVALTVNAVNDTPKSVTVRIFTDEDTTSPPTSPQVDDPDPGDTHTFSILSQPFYGSAWVSSDNKYLSYSPDPDYFGTDSFTLRAIDSGGHFVDGIANISVNAINDPPEAADQYVLTDHHTPIQIILQANDIEGDDLTWVTTSPLHGSITGTAPYLTYTPDPGYAGTDNIVFHVNDGFEDSNSAVVNVKVVSVWFVDNEATGLDDGTSWTNAWSAFADIAWTNIKPGDIIEVSGGILGKTYNETLRLGISGVNGLPIVIMASDNSGHDGTVTLDGKSTLPYAFEIFDHDYCVFDGFNIVNFTSYSVYIRGLGNNETWTETRKGITIKNCTINTPSTQGIHIRYAEDALIQNNVLISGDGLFPEQTDGIYIQGGTNNIIEGNHVTLRNDNNVPHSDCIQAVWTTGSLIIRNNTLIQDNNSVSNKQILYIESHDNGTLQIYNNLLVGINSELGSNVLSISRGNGSVEIFNNTILVNSCSSVLKVTHSYPKIINNVIKQNSIKAAPGIWLDTPDFNPEDIDYNDSYNSSRTDVVGRILDQYYDLDGWNIVTGSHHLAQDPSLGIDYRPDDISDPVVDTGIAVSGFQTDKDGTIRPQGSSWDMGAYEYVP